MFPHGGLLVPIPAPRLAAADLTDVVNKQQERPSRDRLGVNDGESELVRPDTGWHTPGRSPVDVSALGARDEMSIIDAVSGLYGCRFEVIELSDTRMSRTQRLFRADVTGGVRLVMWFVSSRAACSDCAVEMGGLLGGVRDAVVRPMKGAAGTVGSRSTK